MSWIIERVKTAITLLEHSGFEVYLVGGCVRDFLMGSLPKDFDLTTNAKPEEVRRVFDGYRVVETGLRHGTLTIIMDEMPLEITTYRLEDTYSDSRHPDCVNFTTSLQEDLKRRDFTMNAIAYHPIKGLVDPFQGELDIKKKVIRCVGNPDARFEEDALRILRAIRFASVLGFDFEERTRNALFRNSGRLIFISAERTRSELTKLLCGKEVQRVLLDYVDVLGEVIPELLPMKGFQQRTKYHCYDVLVHTAVALQHTPLIPKLRWAVLLHDCGKPLSFTIDKFGNGHFYGHNKVSEELAERILKRLKFDRKTRKEIVTLVGIHDVWIEAERSAVRRCISHLTPNLFLELLEVKRADNWGQAKEYHTQQAYYNQLDEIAKRILSEEGFLSRKTLAVNGRDLKERGLQGREIGQVLEVLLDAVLDGKVENEKEALLRYTEQKRILSK